MDRDGKNKGKVFVKVQILKSNNLDSSCRSKIYQAKLCLYNAKGFLNCPEVAEALGERLHYELIGELSNLVNGMDICMEIAVDDGRPTGT